MAELTKARFPFKRNRLRCVCCVKFLRNKRKRQPIGMLGQSSGNHDWLLANASLRFLRFSFTQRTQRKRLLLTTVRSVNDVDQRITNDKKVNEAGFV